jgi:integrase
MARRRKARYGTGSVIQRGKTYSIKYWDHGKQVMKGGFKERRLAEQALQTRLTQLDDEKVGKKPDPTKVPPLADLAEVWIEQRMNDGLHRSARDDKNRWNGYWKDTIGHLRPHRVDTAVLTRVVKLLLGKRELAPNTVANALRMLSTFYSDLIEEGRANVNPVRMLPKKTRKLVKRPNIEEPFVEKLTDVARIIAHLQKTNPKIGVAYAIGALAGLRTGEIIGLEWHDIALDRRIIHVRRQVVDGNVRPVKDNDEREVGIQTDLAPILTRWKLQTGGHGVLFAPLGRGGTATKKAQHIGARALTKGLHAALKALKQESYLTWYQATRHTFASHYMMAGGDLAKLQAELGHWDIQTTQRYAKMSPDYRTDKDRSLIRLPKLPKGKVVAISEGIGSKLVSSGKRRITRN